MRQYLSLMNNILLRGTDRMTRNGMTRALFAQQLRFDLRNNFPAMTTKKLAFNSMKGELIPFIGGKSNVKDFQALGCNVWNDNAESDYWKPKAKCEGDLGRIYGVQWRDWLTPVWVKGRPFADHTGWDEGHWEVRRIDQLTDVIERLKRDPFDRRLIVTAWNPGELDQMALPPCHMSFQLFVEADIFGKPEHLSLHMNQRSCDMFLGVPFNIASYALLLEMIACVVGLKAHECVITLNDAHLYHEHFEVAKEQLAREPLSLPTLKLIPRESLFDFTIDDIELVNYQHRPAIKAKMLV